MASQPISPTLLCATESILIICDFKLDKSQTSQLERLETPKIIKEHPGMPWYEKQWWGVCKSKSESAQAYQQIPLTMLKETSVFRYASVSSTHVSLSVGPLVRPWYFWNCWSQQELDHSWWPKLLQWTAGVKRWQCFWGAWRLKCPSNVYEGLNARAMYMKA